MRTHEAEYEALVRRVSTWRDDAGIEPHAIGIAARSNWMVKEAAAALGIGFYTADEYIRGVYEKLQVKSRGSAIAKAVKERIVPPQNK